MSRFTTTFWSLLVLLAVVVEETTSLLGSGPHITDVNILLPPKITNPVEYRLQGSDGCFKWFKSYTLIFAPFVCFFFIFGVVVFISNFIADNVFSSLVGLQFMWQLMPETDGTHHLVHVPLKDSPLSDCGGLCGDLDIQIILENSGVFSDLYVVKGIEIGLEKVSVHLLEPEFKDMADNIVLTVAEAMSLEPPSPVYVLIGAAFHILLKLFMRISSSIALNNLVIFLIWFAVVTLPSLHHNWSVSNPSIAQVDTMMGVTRAISLGETVVIVEDTRVAGHIQKEQRPFRLWHVGMLFLAVNILLDESFFTGPSAQEIYITKNDDVKLFDNQSEYWKTFLVSDDIVLKHGWRNSTVLKATSQGMGKLTASLTYFSGHPDTKEVRKVVQEIMVCERVKFSLDRINDMSQSILLPWAPGVYQEVELKATGGCAKASSDYKWFSLDMDTVSISAFGTVQAKKPEKLLSK
ncbi:hypothetical protein LWI28_013681 [Acer negundo]|uniref:NUP210 Ig-like domain-containing protein n=1 Tax=Acer negundo TaxID=4023 RepID=A0AAD5JP97_ACENE|nr:hypothetical protein LWI28_013681 [Acer negundo]